MLASTFVVLAYHVIFGCYGFWLPNDPRGSWSETVRKWELVRFGPSTRNTDRRTIRELTPEELAQREAVRRALRYLPVTPTGKQAAAVGRGFADRASRSNYTIWACSILPEHTHIVLARHTYKVEQMANLLKGSATAMLMRGGIHPLRRFARPGKRPPRMWAEHEWKVYLESEEQIENAIHYVEENPVKEGKPKQTWGFVTPFSGIGNGGWITYH